MLLWVSTMVQAIVPNPPLNSVPACIALRPYSPSRFLDSVQRPGAGGAVQPPSMGVTAAPRDSHGQEAGSKYLVYKQKARIRVGFTQLLARVDGSLVLPGAYTHDFGKRPLLACQMLRDLSICPRFSGHLLHQGRWAQTCLQPPISALHEAGLPAQPGPRCRPDRRPFPLRLDATPQKRPFVRYASAASPFGTRLHVGLVQPDLSYHTWLSPVAPVCRGIAAFHGCRNPPVPKSAEAVPPRP